MDRALPSAAYVVLGLLADQPLTGYQLTQRIGRSVSHFWPITKSHVYTALPRLESSGLASSKEVSQDSAPAKRVYRITAEGRKALRLWLDTADLGNSRLHHPLLLQIFLGQHLSPSRLRTLLHARRDALKASAAHYQALLQQAPPSDPHVRYRTLTVRYALKRLAAEQEWLDEAEKLLLPPKRSRK